MDTIPKPDQKDFIFAEGTPKWIETTSPFDSLDEDWYKIIIFYVFHVPVQGISARAKSLGSFGWGIKGKNNDFKKLKQRLIKYGNMTENEFRCEESWGALKQAIQENNLSDFPTEITCERVSYRKTKSGINDSLLSHIRNSFAHGRLAFYSADSQVYIAMEDVDDKHHVSARMILSKQTLLRWKTIIEVGPHLSCEELEKAINWEDENQCHN